MVRKILLGSILLTALFVAAAAALFSAQPTLAQSATAVDQAQLLPVHAAHDRPSDRRPDRPRDLLTHAQRQEAVAAALGITVAELQAAIADGVTPQQLAEQNGIDWAAVEQSVYEAILINIDTWLANGRISEQQAATLREHLELRRLAHDIFDPEIINATLAGALGVTVAEVESYHAANLCLWQMARLNDVDVDSVRGALAELRNELVDDALADGLITAEQAEILRNFNRRPHQHDHDSDAQTPTSFTPAGDI